MVVGHSHVWMGFELSLYNRIQFFANGIGLGDVVFCVGVEFSGSIARRLNEEQIVSGDLSQIGC